MEWVCGVLTDAGSFPLGNLSCKCPPGLKAVTQWSSVRWRRHPEELSYQLLCSIDTTQRWRMLQSSLWCSDRKSSASVGEDQPSSEQPSLCFLDQCSGVSGPCEVLWEAGLSLSPICLIWWRLERTHHPVTFQKLMISSLVFALRDRLFSEHLHFIGPIHCCWRTARSPLCHQQT